MQHNSTSKQGLLYQNSWQLGENISVRYAIRWFVIYYHLSVSGLVICYLFEVCKVGHAWFHVIGQLWDILITNIKSWFKSQFRPRKHFSFHFQFERWIIDYSIFFLINCSVAPIALDCLLSELVGPIRYGRFQLILMLPM